MDEYDKDTLKELAASAVGRGYITIILGGDDIMRLLHRILAKETNMAGELDALKAEVTNNSDVTQSAISLLQGLKTQLDAAIASGDMSQVQALSDQLGQNDVALASAVAQNTPTPPTPAPTPAGAAGGGQGGQQNQQPNRNPNASQGQPGQQNPSQGSGQSQGQGGTGSPNRSR